MASRRASQHFVERGRAIAAVALLLAAAGCQALSPTSESRQWHTELPAPTAAWLAAEVSRDAFPGADPVPQHAGAPVLRGTTFVVRYTRIGAEGYRITMNGRLVPQARSGDDGGGLPTIAFSPAATTRSATGGEDRLVIRIAPDERGATVTLEVSGTARARHVESRLHRALASAEAISIAAERLRAGADDDAASWAADAIAQAAGMPGLTAIAELLEARAAERAGQLHRARGLATQAVQDDGALLAARCLRRQLDLRLGYDRAGTALPLLPSQPLDAERSTHESALAHARVSESRGDLVAAEHWLLRAAAAPGRDAEEILELARVYDRLHDPRRAYETRLLALELGDDDPDLARALSDGCLHLHDPVRALRWLACEPDKDPLKEARMRVAARRAGERLTRGILYTRDPARSGIGLPPLAVLGAAANEELQQLLGSPPEIPRDGFLGPAGFAASPR